MSLNVPASSKHEQLNQQPKAVESQIKQPNIFQLAGGKAVETVRIAGGKLKAMKSFVNLKTVGVLGAVAAAGFITTGNVSPSFAGQGPDNFDNSPQIARGENSRQQSIEQTQTLFEGLQQLGDVTGGKESADKITSPDQLRSLIETVLQKLISEKGLRADQLSFGINRQTGKFVINIPHSPSDNNDYAHADESAENVVHFALEIQNAVNNTTVSEEEIIGILRAAGIQQFVPGQQQNTQPQTVPQNQNNIPPSQPFFN